MLKLILLLALITFTQTLKLGSHKLYKDYDQLNYLDALEQKQKQLQNDMVTIQQQIENLDRQFNDTNTTDSVKLSKIQEDMADERDTLYDIETYLNLPFSLKACSCKNFTDQEKSSIQEKLLTLQQYIDELNSKVQDCKQCPLIEQIKKQIKSQQNYIQVMNSTLNSQCCNVPKPLPIQNATGLVNLNESLYKDNLNAPNWFYGNMNKTQYKLLAFQQASKYNLTFCPLTSPYATSNMTSCSNCYNGTIFNLETRKCQSCPPFQAFDSGRKRCFTVNCQSNQIFNNFSRLCENCPQNTPIYNSQTIRCERCPFHQNFDKNTNSCVNISCLENQYFNDSIKLCQQCPSQYPIFNVNVSQCSQCPKGSGFNTVTKKCQLCPSSTPYWNKATLLCEKCPGNSIWHDDVKTCFQVECPAQFPKYNPDTQKCQGCPATYVYDQVIKMCRMKDTTGICPPNKPIYDPTSYSCKSCPQNSTYDKLKGQCLHQCQQGENFNWQTGFCQSICSEPLIYINKTCMTSEQAKGCPSNQIFIRSKNKCILISETCNNQTEYYDSASKACQIIPICPTDYQFNRTSLKCQAVDLITSPQSKNLIYPGNFSQYQEYYNKKKKSDPKLLDCPNGHSYYNKNLKSCVSCPAEQPYFNLISSQCQDCGVSQYNNQKRKCQGDQVNVDTTLERLVMNII